MPITQTEIWVPTSREAKGDHGAETYGFNGQGAYNEFILHMCTHIHTQSIYYLRISECFAKAELSSSACAEPRSCGYQAS